MKCLIVNANHIEYTSKVTGERVPAIVLDLVCKNVNSSSGKKVCTAFIGKEIQDSLYNFLLTSCNGKMEELTNLLCNIDYDNNKSVVDFDFIKTEKPAVTWGF